MMTLLRRYRAYLARKAHDARRGDGMIEMQGQTLPWFAPLLLALGICYLFDLKGDESLFVILPLLAITMFGALFVNWVFFIEGPIANFKRARQRNIGDK